jgi:hypothetical protein
VTYSHPLMSNRVRPPNREKNRLSLQALQSCQSHKNLYSGMKLLLNSKQPTEVKLKNAAIVTRFPDATVYRAVGYGGPYFGLISNWVAINYSFQFESCLYLAISIGSDSAISRHSIRQQNPFNA